MEAIRILERELSRFFSWMVIVKLLQVIETAVAVKSTQTIKTARQRIEFRF